LEHWSESFSPSVPGPEIERPATAGESRSQLNRVGVVGKTSST
jgi:hypothetical protein